LGVGGWVRTAVKEVGWSMWDMVSSLFVRGIGMDQRRVLPFHREVQQPTTS
jgi:hypothetical protein